MLTLKISEGLYVIGFAFIVKVEKHPGLSEETLQQQQELCRSLETVAFKLMCHLSYR